LNLLNTSSTTSPSSAIKVLLYGFVSALLVASSLTPAEARQRLTTKSALELVAEIHDRIHRYYVEEVDTALVVEGAVRGLKRRLAELDEGGSVDLQSPLVAMAPAWKRGKLATHDVPKAGRTALQEFERTFRQARLDYMSQLPVDSLARSAVDGMLSTLDPHSTYLEPVENETMQERFRGDFEGIGIYFEIRHGRLLVISPIVGSPSYGKLRAGDHIARIENRTTEGITADQVMQRLRGPKGSRVRIGVRRPGLEQLLHLTIQRDRIQLSSVPYVFTLGDGIGYIRIIQFTESTGSEVASALQLLTDKGTTALILDLRGNGGGLLSQAVEVADYFVDYGDLIVYTRGRDRHSRRDYRARRPRSGKPLPLIALIDEGTASAAEILAGAIQDLDLGLVAGQTSFGKGLVQEQFPLSSNGGLLLLTVARYYSPLGRLIQRPFSADFEAYYRDGGTAAPTDATPAAFLTDLGREVFGGGGITPDVVLSDPPYTDLEQAVLRSGALFDFGSKWVSARDNWPPRFDRFLVSYEVPEEALRALLDLLEQRELRLTLEERERLQPWLKQHLKSEFARVLWGDEAHYRISVEADSQILQSIDLVDAAERLVQQRWR
jgi:carboxyl-terminal processing protease